MTKIRILHIIEQLGVGGAERQLLGLLSRMDRDRFDHSVAYFVQWRDSMDRQFRDLGCPTSHVAKVGVPVIRFFQNLRRVIKFARPDIVHTWLYSANFWGRWAAVTCGVKHIVTSDRAEIQRHTFPVRLYERLLAGRTVRLANSRAVAESLKRHYGLSLDRVKVIYNAVDLSECDRAQARLEIRRELGLPADHRVVMMLGRQAPEKNYPMFLKAGKIVCTRRDNVTFIAVGRQDYKADVDHLLAELNMGTRVRFLDQKEDVHRWLAAADVFCFTSSHEGFPNAVLEAMLAGLPIVCTEFASAREVLDEGTSGIVVPVDDERALAREVEDLIDDPERGVRLGTHARERARTLFSWAVLVHKMESLYAGLLEGRGRITLSAPTGSAPA